MTFPLQRSYIWTITDKDCPFDFCNNLIFDSQIFVTAIDVDDAKRKIKTGFKNLIWLNADWEDLPENKSEEEKEIRKHIFKNFIEKIPPQIQNISKMIISTGGSSFPTDTRNDSTSEKCFIWNIDSSSLFSSDSEYFKYLLSKDIFMPCEIEVCIIALNLESARFNIESKLQYSIWLNQSEKYSFTEIEKKYLLNYLLMRMPTRICGTSNKPLVIVALK